MILESDAEKLLVADLIVGAEPETVKNPYSGEATVLCPEGVALYDLIKGAEMISDFETVEMGLAIFSRNWPSEYMTLLD